MKNNQHGQKPEYRLLVAGGDFIRCRDYEEYMRVYWKLRLLGLGTRYVREENDSSRCICRFYYNVVREGQP